MRLDGGPVACMTIPRALAAVAAALSIAACTAPSGDAAPVAESEEAVRVTASFTSRGTAYYPANTRLEGGFLDRRGAKLRTLQQFLDGDAEYVSVAMDTRAFKYGQRLRIRELEEKYEREIVFRVVDTGGAFRGKGRTRIDICVKDRAASYDPTINGVLHIDALDESDEPPPDAGPGPDASDPP